MNQIILDAQTRRKLGDLKEPLAICDESGKVLAQLIPCLDPSRDEPVEPVISADELERRRRERAYSTADVLAHLDKLS